MRRMVLLGVLVGLVATLRADEEPTFLDKKLSEWLKLLHEGKDAKARRRGVVAVEQIGQTASKRVVPALLKAFREDQDASVRAAAGRAAARAAARALEQARQTKTEDPPRFDLVRDALAAALRAEKDNQVREAAAAGLGILGTDSRGTAPTLATVLKDSHAPTVRAAAAALRRQGREASEAQPELVVLLRDAKGDLEARVDAAIALGQIRFDPSTLAALKEVLNDPGTDIRIRRAAIESVARLGKDGGPLSADLGALLVGKETPELLRLVAVTSLEQLGNEAKPALAELIQTVGDPQVIKLFGENSRLIRCLAMQTLARMGKDLDARRKDAVLALLRAMDEPALEVCVSAIETLGVLSADGLADQGDEVVKKLDTLLLREGRKSIREAAEATRLRIRPVKK